MPKKDKKADKKGQKENKEQLSAVDKTFYEITINDLNSKLSNLRKRNAELEENNVELEAQMLQLDEDRADIIAFLNRTVFTQKSEIKSLEEKLSELAKVRGEETEKFQETTRDWECKFKVMHEQLSSEIKLLAGKLNYLEEFRLQHDDLMAKFDQQDRNLKEQEQRHKETLYELEHKQIAEKVLLKNQLETRLLELSNEFTQANKVRTAAHVQRLTRENILLNNEIRQLLNTVERVKTENDRIAHHNREQRRLSTNILEENACLVDASEKHLKIIARLTKECGKLKTQVKKLDATGKLCKMAEIRETASRKELNEAKSKLESMQLQIVENQRDCQAHLENAAKHREEMVRLFSISRQLKKKLGNALSKDATIPFENKRQQLLEGLLGILTAVEEIDVETKKSIETDDNIMPLDPVVYQKGKIGIAPRRDSTTNVLKFSSAPHKGRRKSILDVRNDQLKSTSRMLTSLIGCAIIDIDDDLAHHQSSLSVQNEEEEEEKTSYGRKPSMIQMSYDGNENDNDDHKPLNVQ